MLASKILLIYGLRNGRDFETIMNYDGYSLFMSEYIICTRISP